MTPTFRDPFADTVTAPTNPPLLNTPGKTATSNTLIGLNALPNAPGDAVVRGSLGGLATSSEVPPPPAGGATRRQLRALGAAFPVTQEEGVTWFG